MLMWKIKGSPAKGFIADSTRKKYTLCKIESLRSESKIVPVRFYSDLIENFIAYSRFDFIYSVSYSLCSFCLPTRATPDCKRHCSYTSEG